MSNSKKKPPWGSVKRIALTYQKYRRQYVSKNYWAFSPSGDPSASRNWPHFERAAALAQENGASEEEWVAAQFIGADPNAYPYPSNLYSKNALRQWKHSVNFVNNYDSNIKYQRQQLTRFCMKWGLTPNLTVLLFNFIRFDNWFIAMLADEEDVPLEIAEAARAQVGSEKLKEAMRRAGMDPGVLVTKIERILAKHEK